MFKSWSETANARRALEDPSFLGEADYGLAIVDAEDSVDLDDVLLDSR